MYIRNIPHPTSSTTRTDSRHLGQLFIGGKPDIDTLLRHNIGAVVTVSKMLLPEDIDKHYKEWAFYFHLQDGKTLSVEKYYEAAHSVSQCLLARKNVLVHCLAGRNRSCLVAALALRGLHHLTGEEALTHVQHYRPNSFHNPVQAEWLRGLPRV